LSGLGKRTSDPFVASILLDGGPGAAIASRLIRSSLARVTTMASSERFTAEQSLLLVVDLQGKLLERIEGRESLVANVARLI
jgi:hypothetical protein